MTARSFLAQGAALLLLAAACKARPRLTPGSPAPELALEDVLQAPPGGVRGWESLRGKVAVLEFWNIDCISCVDALPHLNRLAAKFKGRVQFIYISRDGVEDLRKFLLTHTIDGWVASDPRRRMLAPYLIYAVPRTVLVDAQGKLAAAAYPLLVGEKELELVLAGRSSELSFDESQAEPKALAAMVGGGESQLPVFEVRIATSPAARLGYKSGPGFLKSTGMPLVELVAYAYGVSPARVDFPSSRASARYDVLLHMPAAADDEPKRRVLREALGSAFGLRARKVRRSVDAYLIGSAGRAGPNLKSPASVEGSSVGGPPAAGHFQAENSGLAGLRWFLEDALRRPVLDRSGLAGRYDMRLDWDPKREGDLERAMLKQLGLRLARGKAEIETLEVQEKSGR